MPRHLLFSVAIGLCLLASCPAAIGQQVNATGGVAIGGGVSNSTINVGVPPEQLAALIRQASDLSETQKKLITELEGKLDLNQRQIRAALDILGEANVPAEGLAAKLVEIAERFKALQAGATAQPGDDPNIATLKADAQKAIEGGDLANADALLAEVEEQQRRALGRLAGNAAETAARRGDLAMTRLRYLEAAEHFADAAAMFPPGSADTKQRFGYLLSEADALYRQGDEFGDNGALRSAIERLRRVVDLVPRERVPLDWAMTQNNLGNALVRLGEREVDTARLEEAVTAYRDALKERTRERVPLDWATTQNNLGTALSSLGERESGTARREEAVTAYRDALKEYTRERVPLDWAMTQNNLGNALVSLGERESGTARLEEAVTAYRDALKERTRERVPLDWATTQTNLGNALMRLGERESGTVRLEEAVTVYRDALKERTRERVPLDWAKTQTNLGAALVNLGERASGTARLEEAVTAFRDALKEWTRERAPLDWAMSTGNQGVALSLLAERTRNAALAKTAVALIEAARDATAGAHAPNTAYYEAKLAVARKVAEQIRRR
jgi:tetratricopeptide (TPR) repeat protein